MAETNSARHAGDAAGRDADQLGGRIGSLNSQFPPRGQEVRLPIRTDRHRDPIDWMRERRIISAAEFLTVADRDEPVSAWRRAQRLYGLGLAEVVQAERRASGLRNGGW